MRSWTPVLAVLAAALACQDAQDAATCENASHVEIPSPDEQLSAWVFVRSCGDASSAHVSILPAGAAPPAEAGNAFVVDPIVAVSVEWPGDHRLHVTHGSAGEVSKQEYQVAGVTVTYRTE